MIKQYDNEKIIDIRFQRIKYFDDIDGKTYITKVIVIKVFDE